MKNTINTTTKRDYEIRKAGFDVLINPNDLRNKRILDIGCGFGAFLMYALEKGAKEVSGVEISEQDLKTAKKSLQAKNVILKEGSAINLPFPDSYFDTVVSFEVLEHIPKNTELKMFSEINRVLKKEGILYLSTPYASIISKYLDPAFYLIGHRHYSKKQLEIYASKNNLQILKLRTIGTIWEFFNLYSLYFSKWVLRREKIFEKEIISRVLKDLKDEDKIGFMNIFIKAKKN
jgi:ubiquinone/menaquinone biosynthesis C-methylase UbiE